MNEKEFIPGPWGTVQNPLNDVIEIYGGGVNTFAVVYIKRGELKKAMATARLMAEAPALLEACEEALRDYEAHIPGATTIPDKLRAAIARVKVGVS